MNRKFIGAGICAKWMMGALALAIASASYASSTTLVGGGSTLPAYGYIGNAAGNPASPASGSLWSVAGANVTYCKTSDAVALEVFSGALSALGTCPNKGFGGTTAGETQPNYVALAAPLDVSDYNNYESTHSPGYPTQFPALAASIAIAFNLKDNTGAQVTSSEVNFTDAQVCEIFSGEVTNWSDSRLVSAFTLPAGRSIPAGLINVQYRSEGTGTTFGLSNHLANVCGEINSTYFETSAAFVSMVANFEPTLPSNWTGSNGNAALMTAIVDTADSLGYVEQANATSTNPTLQLADVNGASPTTNFGNPLTITGIDLVYNEVISNTNAANGTAQIQAITNPPTTACIAMVKPSDYAAPGTKGSILPAGTYPIVDMTYLLGNAQGNPSTQLAATQALLESPYNATYQGETSTVGLGTGLAFLTLGANAFTATDVGACIH